MDRMKMVLGAIIALLLGALVVSWKQLNDVVKNAPAPELQAQTQVIAQIQADNQRMIQEIAQLKSQQELAMAKKAAEPVVPVITPEQQQKELEEKQAQLEALKAQEKKVSTGEDGLMEQRNLEKSDRELRRGRLVGQAMLIATIREWVNSPQGQFAVVDVLARDQVKIGTELALRRNAQMIMKLQITAIESDGVVATPVGPVGNIAPQVGDELILPPA